MRQNFAERGFTLIELLIVLAIGAIVITIAVPSFQNSIERNRLTGATNDFVHTINFARLEAIKRGRSINIKSVSDNTTWSSGVEVSAGADLIRKLEGSESGITITSSTVKDITFKADGFVANAGDTFNVCPATGKEGRQITVNLSGRVNINSDYMGCN